MSKIDSSLSQRGIEICNQITNLTGISTYYYLYRHNDQKRSVEEKRKCPSCGGDWLLKEPLHSYLILSATNADYYLIYLGLFAKINLLGSKIAIILRSFSMACNNQKI